MKLTQTKYPPKPQIYISQFLYLTLHLINFDGSKDSLIEDKACSNTNKSSHQEQTKWCQSHVSKVKDVGGNRICLQLLEVYEGVKEDVNSSRPTSTEGTPPPVIILPTKLEVVEEDSDFSRGNNKDGKHK